MNQLAKIFWRRVPIRAMEAARAGACGNASGTLPDRGAAATPEDLDALGLTGRPDSAAKRAKAGAALGIGYCNGKAMAKRVAALGITRKELEEALGTAQGE